MASAGVGSNTISVGSEIVVLERLLGRGAFGVVYKARNQRGREYALKDIACSAGTCANELAEIGMLRQVSHQNIVQIIASGERMENGVRHILILTEFCSGGNLNERLNRPNSRDLALKWLKQLASALSYLHDRNIVHRDLKPENVLLTDRSNEDIKLGDFGLARQFVALIQGPSLADDWINYYMKTFAGSPPWMAPEVFNGHYTEKADVFSLGCIFYAILVRQYNTYDGKRYYGAFVSVLGNTMPLGYAMARTRDSNLMVAFPAAMASTPKLRQITIAALQFNPNSRPTARGLRDAMYEL